jgi:molybdate transport system substrate-binding protein
MTIAAASDLRYALDELSAAYRSRNPNVRLDISYGSSGTFYAQLRNGAPFDVFLSADSDYPRQLGDRGMTLTPAPFRYAQGRIVLWASRASTIDPAEQRLDAVSDPNVRHVAVANPEHAPYGRAAIAALRSAGLLERVESKLVYGDYISQSLQFVQSGSADIGIVALSLALAPSVASSGRYWVIPSEAHPPIEQGGTILRSTRHAAEAFAFRDFMLGAEARTILSRYGLEPPAGSGSVDGSADEPDEGRAPAAPALEGR